MKIAIGSDFSGFRLKEVLRKHLISRGVSFDDLGQTVEDDKLIYVDVAKTVAEKVSDKIYERAILICGSGAGVCVTANKYKGVYAVVCESSFTAERCKIVNKANILCFGEGVIGHQQAINGLDKWLDTDCYEGLAEDRKEMLEAAFGRLQAIEDENFK